MGEIINKRMKEQYHTEAVKQFAKKLWEKKRDVITSTLPAHDKRHRLIKTENGVRYYLLAKEDSFRSWKIHYPELREIDEVVRVDSMNEEVFNLIKNNVDYVVFIYENDPNVYVISIKDYMTRSNTFGLRRHENALSIIRTTGGKVKYEDAYLVSCPLYREEVW